MRRLVKSAAVAALSLAALASRVAWADPHTESVAKEAMQKAASAYAAANYVGAVAELNRAVQACGAKNCTPQTKGALLRDIGTMQFRAGDKDAAGKSWNDALEIDSSLTMNPAYDASDVGAAWEDARASVGLPAGPVSTKPPPGGAAASGPAAGGPHGAPPPQNAGAAPALPAVPPADQPSGDFDHDPAIEQKEDTPLPIHAEYAGNTKLSQVVVKYKGPQMREWARIELKNVGGSKYEGLVPCADVTRGMMRYWIQGFDKAGDPVAATGDPKHPYVVIIRDKITSEPPHLPGKEPPRSCEESDCPPGLPGCSTKGTAGPSQSVESAPTKEEAEGPEDHKKKGRVGLAYTRVWIGVSGALDFISLPGDRDVCARDPNTGSPSNSSGYYCYDPAGQADFPISKDANQELIPRQSGTTTGALQSGDLRILLTLDYATSPSVLLGVRAGYVANAYPGKNAVTQGHAFFAPLHFEARATYLLGDAPLTHSGFAPMGFAGLGLSEFDGHQSTGVRSIAVTAPKIVDAWLTDAPFFVVIGAGVRYQFSTHAALTAAARLNGVIGGNGLMATFGPEIGVLYGF